MSCRRQSSPWPKARSGSATWWSWRGLPTRLPPRPPPGSSMRTSCWRRRWINSVGKFHHICRHLRHAADPKGAVAAEVDLVENRSLSISTDEDSGAVFLNGVFDPVGGAAIRTALEPLARRTGADDDRPYDRRMADALVDVSMHRLDNAAQRPRPALRLAR